MSLDLPFVLPVKQVKQSETANAVQETVEVPLRQALVDCPAFRDGMCVYESGPCEYKGRRGECKLQVRKLNHNPCPCPFQDWPLSCCAVKDKPFVKARQRATRTPMEKRA